ncbi:hypothetical protein EJ05DRAFT_473855 [Pseudovirgaria hyperparasitica]|uniref:Uncharacterized protein n=1 Tax=Pseudovirgaria hyperparasitica TaxID=470096 RepID=A0A6A6WGW9_9PEZI|nr:uncharacterized protein EJ05DRAFT_473855 [Pseudovirgaria hyperparasitica]KAF2761335.1 hypothetical protein EJ05DRAFT_473855 [Pseudovirgaria hyperparasitica]
MPIRFNWETLLNKQKFVVRLNLFRGRPRPSIDTLGLVYPIESTPIVIGPSLVDPHPCLQVFVTLYIPVEPAGLRALGHSHL